MPTPHEWYRKARAILLRENCDHEITKQVFCEEDCCGASLIWEECRCGDWVYVPGAGRMTMKEMCGEDGS